MPVRQVKTITWIEATHPTSLYLSFPVNKMGTVMPILPPSQEAVLVRKHARQLEPPQLREHCPSRRLGGAWVS